MEKKKVTIVDVTLRDGSHAMEHQFTAEQIFSIAEGLDQAHIPVMEITHGDGLGGSSLQYGFSRLSEEELLKTGIEAVKDGKVAALLLPGIGTLEELKPAMQIGVQVVRVATHCTEADISKQHIQMAKQLGATVVGFLMMAHMVGPEKIAEQGRLMASYGADVVYVVDSAGAMTPDMVRSRIAALREAVNTAIGFHGHNNLGLAVANSLVAIEEGATWVDGSLAGLGAGAGNTQTEVLVAVLDRLGYETGIDLYKVMDVAEEVVRPIMPRPIVIDRDSLTIGYAGVYSTFLIHARHAAERFGVEARDILLELGKRKMVGGQEDMIIDVAVEMAERLKN